MAILYKLTFTLQTEGTAPFIGSVPPSIKNSTWWENFFLESLSGIHGNFIAGDKRVQRFQIFDTVEEASAWFDAHRLTDPALLADLDEYKTTHNVTITETWHEIPNITPGITGIFG